MTLVLVAIQASAPAPAAPPAAQVQGVSFAYPGRAALQGLTLSVPAGSVFGLLGPNGSGKSTLLSLLAGLRAPDAGQVRVLGQAPSPAVRARMGFVFQESSLDSLMTLREALGLHGRLYGLSGTALRSAVGGALQSVGLEGRGRDAVGTLSGGMKRRLELARALLTAPDLLLLDEPTTGLDPDSELAFWGRIAEVNARGVTVLLATNKVGEADRYCGRVAFIHEGRVVAEGSPQELKAGLKHDAVWVEGDFSASFVDAVAAWPEVGRLKWAPPLLHATVDSASTFVPRLFQAAGGNISSIRLREATLEDAYFDLVGASINGGRQ